MLMDDHGLGTWHPNGRKVGDLAQRRDVTQVTSLKTTDARSCSTTTFPRPLSTLCPDNMSRDLGQSDCNHGNKSAAPLRVSNGWAWSSSIKALPAAPQGLTGTNKQDSIYRIWSICTSLRWTMKARVLWYENTCAWMRDWKYSWGNQAADSLAMCFGTSKDIPAQRKVIISYRMAELPWHEISAIHGSTCATFLVKVLLLMRTVRAIMHMKWTQCPLAWRGRSGLTITQKVAFPMWDKFPHSSTLNSNWQQQDVLQCKPSYTTAKPRIEHYRT